MAVGVLGNALLITLERYGERYIWAAGGRKLTSFCRVFRNGDRSWLWSEADNYIKKNKTVYCGPAVRWDIIERKIPRAAGFYDRAVLRGFMDGAGAEREEFAMALHVMDEANRCLGCKVPQCRKGCPIDTPIPEVIRLLKEKSWTRPESCSFITIR